MRHALEGILLVGPLASCTIKRAKGIKRQEKGPCKHINSSVRSKRGGRNDWYFSFFLSRCYSFAFAVYGHSINGSAGRALTFFTYDDS